MLGCKWVQTRNFPHSAFSTCEFYLKLTGTRKNFITNFITVWSKGRQMHKDYIVAYNCMKHCKSKMIKEILSAWQESKGRLSIISLIIQIWFWIGIKKLVLGWNFSTFTCLTTDLNRNTCWKWLYRIILFVHLWNYKYRLRVDIFGKNWNSKCLIIMVIMTNKINFHLFNINQNIIQPTSPTCGWSE
jgi:hypothetical protein